jgi:cobalt/nickel transport system permease protein
VKHSFLDRYSDLGSFVHRLDPRTKLITTFAFILVVVLTPPLKWQAFAIYFSLLIALILLSKVPPLYVLKRSLVIVPFVLFIAIFIPFFKPGEVAGSYNILMWEISVTYSGLIVLWNVVIKAWLSVLSLILLSSTTKFPELLKGLEQLRMPRVMVMILSFMYRYIFVLVDEVVRMKQARDSRNFGGKRMWQLKTIGNMVGTLFIRSYERGERIYVAMVARGFDYETRTLSNLRFERADLYFGMGFLMCLAMIGLSTLFYL